MTNADKYNLTREQAKELCYEIATFCNGTVQVGMIMDFFYCPLQPTLTEDERVILRNIDKNFKYIARVNKQIQVCTVKTSNRGLPCDSGYLFTFNHLFQFIKERRRI